MPPETKPRVAIAHLAHYKQLTGGAEMQLAYLADYLTDRGNAVHYIYLDRHRCAVEHPGVELHPIRHWNVSTRFGKYWFLHKKGLTKILDGIQPEAIITRTWSSWQGIVAHYAHVRDIAHVHFWAADRDLEELHYSPKAGRPMDIVENHLASRLFNRKSTLICQNDIQVDALKHKHAGEVIKSTQAAPVPPTQQTIKPTTKLRVLWIGNLKPIKRPERFLEIAKRYAENSAIEFIMIGGDKRNAYRSILAPFLHQKNFTYLGAINNDAVNRQLEQAHILLNTSDTEGFSNTFVQAWLRGVVVISLNSDPDRILSTGRGGFMAHDLESMNDRIEQLLKHPELLKTVSASAQTYATQRHTIDAVYGKLMQHFMPWAKD